MRGGAEQHTAKGRMRKAHLHSAWASQRAWSFIVIGSVAQLCPIHPGPCRQQSLGAAGVVVDVHSAFQTHCDTGPGRTEPGSHFVTNCIVADVHAGTPFAPSTPPPAVYAGLSWQHSSPELAAVVVVEQSVDHWQCGFSVHAPCPPGLVLMLVVYTLSQKACAAVGLFQFGLLVVMSARQHPSSAAAVVLVGLQSVSHRQPA